MKLILGTMTFGPQVDTITGLAMVKKFIEKGYKELDTAYVYNEGETENILGTILIQTRTKSVSIATKIHPRITGKLDGQAITMQLNESLKRLKKDSVDILYFHFPDPITPIDKALEECNRLHKQGKFKELGLSNFPSWMVVDIWHICKKNGWIQPTVYQGMYNSLTRNVELELIPALRKIGIRFYAFNPLAGGMLSGKHSCFDENPTSGRFARLESYRNRYWKKSYISAVNNIKNVCIKNNIKPAEAAFRWLAYHSKLDNFMDDGIIIGASSLEQFDQNILSINNGSLPKKIVNVFNNAWEEVKKDSPPYFKFFTGH